MYLLRQCNLTVENCYLMSYVLCLTRYTSDTKTARILELAQEEGSGISFMALRNENEWTEFLQSAVSPTAPSSQLT